MAATDNSISIVGNLTNDPELRFTPGGRQVANFSVAVNRRFRNQGGQWEDRLEGFFRCNCWGELAENVAESLHKGTRVIVVGRLQQRTWEDQQGGRREAVEIQVDDMGPSVRWATATITKSRRSGGAPARTEAPTAAEPAQAAEWPASAVGGGSPEEEGSV